jgi:periplasmic copper chaperone A
LGRKLAVIIGITALTLGSASTALAHVTVQPEEAVVGSFARFVVRVPNERDGASTTKIEMELPPLPFVSFQPKPGWKRTIEMRTLDEPLEVFGDNITEVVGRVTWSGGKIGPGEFDEFGFSARVPEVESTLEFPAIQTYSNGEVVRWIGPAESEEPAAQVRPVDIGAAEGEGELAVLAQAAQGEGSASPSSSDEDEEGIDLGIVLGGLGTLLGGIALGRTWRRGA